MLRGAVPGQEVVNAVDRMVGDVGQHMAEPGLGVNTVELGGADQRVDRGCPFAAAVGAGEQVVAPAAGSGHTGWPPPCPTCGTAFPETCAASAPGHRASGMLLSPALTCAGPAVCHGFRPRSDKARRCAAALRLSAAMAVLHAGRRTCAARAPSRLPRGYHRFRTEL